MSEFLERLAQTGGGVELGRALVGTKGGGGNVEYRTLSPL